VTVRPFDKLKVALSKVEGRHAHGPEPRRGMRVFGIDPGSERTGYGCVDSDGRRHQLVRCGAVRAGAGATFPDQLSIIYRELTSILAECRPECVAIENVFHAVNARSALKLGHARGVAMLAAIEAGVTVVEYTPAEIKRSVVGYGRAEKPQVAQMVKFLLGLDAIPKPHDATDALAVAICHLHNGKVAAIGSKTHAPGPKTWRSYRP
jgi:crossover junction endodeoxyribonuclease RuvC